MNIHQVVQGSPEWLQARLGIPTASEFFRILSPTGQVSSQSESYLCRCLAEWIIGTPIEEDYQSQWMIRGHELEGNAVSSYEFASGNETEVVGFVTNDAGTAGCSPDRFVGKNRGLEIKVHSPQVQVRYLLDKRLDSKHKPQIQGCLYICERELWDACGFCPGLPMSIITCERDEPYIKKLAALLDTFTDKLAEAKALLTQKYGIVGKLGQPLPEPVIDKYGFDVTDDDVDAIMAMNRKREAE